MAAHQAVGGPNRGRRFEVVGLNRAAVVMLAAHFEGYLEDVFREAFLALPGGLDPAHVVSRFSNPSPTNINKLFSVIGMTKPTTSVRWQGASNESVLRNLNGLVETRHRIAHGVLGVPVYKQEVERYRRYVEGFSRRFDGLVGDRIEQATGARPW